MTEFTKPFAAKFREIIDNSALSAEAKYEMLYRADWRCVPQNATPEQAFFTLWKKAFMGGADETPTPDEVVEYEAEECRIFGIEPPK